MNKQKFINAGLITLLFLSAVAANAQTVSLDNAITGMVDELSGDLQRGSTLAVLSMRTNFPRMASYIVGETTSSIVNKQQFSVVSRAELDLLRQEMHLQLSGDVSDESAQAIGKQLGAQVIITGSFEPVGNYYRFRLWVIEVETATIRWTYSRNVRKDAVVSSLLGTGETLSAEHSQGAAATASLSYYDFTTEQRWGTWALNTVIPGLGSYLLMKDILGGSINLGLMGVGGVLIYVGIIDIRYTRNFKEYSLRIPSLVAGSLFLLGGTVFNITRSFFYHKPYPKTASILDPESWNIAILPGEKGIEYVHLSYTMRF